MADDLVSRLLAAIDEREWQHTELAKAVETVTSWGGKVDAAGYLRAATTEGLRLCQAHREIVAMFPASAPVVDDSDCFHGFQSRDCGEHRTVGTRAWCHDCSEWCYPGDPCQRCHGISEVIKVLARGYDLTEENHDG